MTKIKAILFDLDGTLLPVDQEEFTKAYFGLVAAKAAPLGYEPKRLVDAVWAGTIAMVKNDGKESNETVFWKKFSSIFSEDARKDREVFDDFYRVEFNELRKICRPDPDAAAALKRIKALGFRVALATNPLFPSVATENRIRWAGLEPGDFEFYTAYETIGLSKPNPKYYLEVANRIGLEPNECAMVGNDAFEDGIAGTVGMRVFLLTDCLINKDNRDISAIPHGSFKRMMEWAERLNQPAAE